MTTIDKLKKYSRELIDLHHIAALLQWDQEVYLPERGGEERASQLMTLSRLIHKKEVSARLGALLEEAEQNKDRVDEKDRALLRVMRRSFDQSSKLPEKFVADFAGLTARAQGAWDNARKHSDFSIFRPFLADIVTAVRRKAEYLGYARTPYDALLDLHEEGLTTATCEKLFDELKKPLSEMVRALADKKQVRLRFDTDFARFEQNDFADFLLESIGFDFKRGRQDRSAHPFTTSLGHDDRRVTNRYGPRSLEFIFSALHEGGHAVYEQGISDELSQTHLDTGVSLGIHESQSRLWENIIGRSPAFWDYMYPHLQKKFPDKFKDLCCHDFVQGINYVKPGKIRVEADEVTYNLHVIIRFELEKKLIDGTLAVDDLPGAWNAMYEKLLQVKVADDADGVLQDVHWSHGALGYFPTYTIGNVTAAQIWNTFSRARTDHEELIRSGNFKTILGWLREYIYRHGSVYPPGELLERITGEKLTARYFLAYLRQKYLGRT